MARESSTENLSSVGPSQSKQHSNLIRLSTLRGFWLLPWIVPAATAIYMKYTLLTQSGYRVTAEAFGRTKEFGPWEKLSFFQMDVIVAVFATVALFLVGRLLPRRLRLLFVSGLSAGISLALYAQLRAFWAVGQFLSFRMFWTAITWGLHEPAAYSSYLGIKKLLVVSGVVVITLGTVRQLLKLP